MTISIDPQKTNNESLQPKGWLRYFSFSLDHKVIGIQYLVCGFLFYLIGGTLASAIRIELASPMSDFMPRDIYNQVLTLHGTIMIFLWIVPVVNGAFGNYLAAGLTLLGLFSYVILYTVILKPRTTKNIVFGGVAVRYHL